MGLREDPSTPVGMTAQAEAKGKEQPETLALPKPGAKRKTVGLSPY